MRYARANGVHAARVLRRAFAAAFGAEGDAALAEALRAVEATLRRGGAGGRQSMSETRDVVREAIEASKADALKGLGGGGTGQRDLRVATARFVYPGSGGCPDQAVEPGEVFAAQGQRLDWYLEQAGAFRRLQQGERKALRADGRLFVEQA